MSKKSHICPLCGESNCYNEGDSESNSVRYDCKKFNRTVLLGSSVEACLDIDQKRKLFNLIFEYVIRNPMCDGKSWWFFNDIDYEKQEVDDPWRVNLAEIQYPRSFSEKVDRVLLNLYYAYPEYADSFSENKLMARIVFADTEQECHDVAFLKILKELGYLTDNSPNGYSINAKGWIRLEELTRRERETPQGFIAMRFSEETRFISEAFKKSINAAGYKAMRIDEKDHNNQIVPEIFFEIDRSRFLVMDATFPNCGAYYEAGYALAKGKQVIICCRKKEFDDKESAERPHFDIQQKSMIIWDNEDDLVKKLTRRIETTVKGGIIRSDI